ncbi:MAG: DUF362 domain-containing protein [Promethearchaeota archaeon]|jgi:uncharacterized protein (DUF362 family)
MKDQASIKTNEVAIVKGQTPQESVLKGIELLGGISNFIEEGDQIFIKFNLNFPYGFPTNTNFEVLKSLIEACNKAGAKKVYLGSFPFEGSSIKSISSLLNLEGYFTSLDAELVFLDNSDFFYEKKIKEEELEIIRNKSFLKVKIDDIEYIIPKIIKNSDKFISVNQVNVNPLFKLNLSLLNSYSIIPPKYQKINKKGSWDDNYLQFDKYKSDLVSNILEIFSLRQPDLVINDLFYLLDRAGPNVYKDSDLKKTGVVVLGTSAASVDLITLRMLNVEIQSHDLVLEAQKKGLGVTDLQKITLLGENLEDIDIDVEFCKSKLEDINLKNFIVKSGQSCSGCYQSAYHFLNLMKSNMTKDLKYNPRNAFLIGKNPPELDQFENVIIFGECAIKSTENSNFRKVRTQSEKFTIGENKNKTRRKKLTQKEPKIKIKRNKKILELPGCPPEIFDCIDLMISYYGKKNTPNLTFYRTILETWINPKIKETLKMLEIL